MLEGDDVLMSIIETKSLRRRELSKLPLKKKIEILIQLQKMAKGIKRTGKGKKNTVWVI